MLVTCSAPRPGQKLEEVRELLEIERTEFSVWLSRPEAAAPLIDGLRSAFPRTRAAAARALGRAGRGDQVAALAALYAREEDASVRREAVFALGRLGGDQAFPALSRAASDVDPVTRGAAARALPSQGASVLPLLGSLLRDRAPAVRQQAALALADHPELAADADLAVLLAEERDERVRWAIVKAVAARPDMAAGVARRLSGLVLDRNFLVSVFAVDVLARLEGGAGVEETLELVRNPARPWQARLAGLEALRTWRGRSPLPADSIQASLEESGDAPPLLCGNGAARELRREVVSRWRRRTAPPRRPPVALPPGSSPDSGGVDALTPYAYEPAAFSVAEGARNPRLVLVFEGVGETVVELYRTEAPHHVAALVDLVRRGKLDGRRAQWAHGLVGVEFHAADGDPVAGCQLPPEEYRAEIRHGTLFESPARPGGGRFVIALAPLPELEGRVTVLGRVVLGTRALDRLQSTTRIQSYIFFQNNGLR